MTRFAEVLQVLARADVRFILIGGLAATAHGSARATQDIDLVYDRSPENLEKIVGALAPYQPYPRGAPQGLPFRLDVETLKAGLNFTLTTKLGWIDMFGEIPGGGTYQNLAAASLILEIFGEQVRLLNLDALIRAKKATGRPKDYETLAELESIKGHCSWK